MEEGESNLGCINQYKMIFRKIWVNMSQDQNKSLFFKLLEAGARGCKFTKSEREALKEEEGTETVRG